MKWVDDGFGSFELPGSGTHVHLFTLCHPVYLNDSLISSSGLCWRWRPYIPTYIQGPPLLTLLTPLSVCKSRVPIFDADKVALFHSLPAAFSTLFTHLPPHHFSNSVSFQLISKCSLDFEQSSYAGIFKNHTNFLSFFSFFFSLHDSLKEKERRWSKREHKKTIVLWHAQRVLVPQKTEADKYMSYSQPHAHLGNDALHSPTLCLPRIVGVTRAGPGFQSCLVEVPKKSSFNGCTRTGSDSAHWVGAWNLVPLFCWV